MLNVVIIFLWASVFLYIVTGGADFGAGIIELVIRKGERENIRKIMYRATGPIWEANNMWLIITIVILFIGFPSVYAFVSSYLYIPLTIMLIGIIGRGTAFVFRNYDAVEDNLQFLYRLIYISSSILTPLFMGMIAASLFTGAINPDGNNFLDLYVNSWFNRFALFTGLFTVLLCAYLAIIYVIGDSGNGPARFKFIPTAIGLNIAVLLLGTALLITAKIDHMEVASVLWASPVSRWSVIAVLLSLITMWVLIYRKSTSIIRFLAGFQVFMIQVALLWKRFPTIFVTKNGLRFSVFDDQVQSKTIDILGLSLLIGSIFIIPALIYLIYLFEWHPKKSGSANTLENSGNE